MPKKRYNAEEVIQKLREPTFCSARGKSSARPASRSASVTAPEIQTIFDAGSAGKCKPFDPEPCMDGVPDSRDNCLDACNTGQDDTDNDDCGNLCDADYDQSGTVGFSDFGQFVAAFGTGDEEKCHVEPILGCTVGFSDFSFFLNNFALAPGPSTTTAGTTACP